MNWRLLGKMRFGIHALQMSSITHDGPWQGTKQIIGYGQDHQVLGKGDLDVGRFLDRLVEAHFDGPVIFELSIAAARQTLEVIRELRPQLFL